MPLEAISATNVPCPIPPRHAVSESFVQAHREAQRAFNSGDTAAAFNALAPDVVWHTLGKFFGPRCLTGRDAVARYFQGLADAIDWRVEAQEFLYAGHDRVLIHQLGAARDRLGERGRIVDFFQLWELGPDGLATSVREFESRDAADDLLVHADQFEAPGVTPEPLRGMCEPPRRPTSKLGARR